LSLSSRDDNDKIHWTYGTNKTLLQYTQHHSYTIDP
jgi:hypothetical protein